MERTIMEIEDPDDGVSFINCVVKVGTGWCGPCKKAHAWMHDIISEGKEYTHVDFYTINYEAYDVEHYKHVDKMLSARVAQVTSFPTFFLFHNNRLVEKLVGWNEKELRKAIEKKLHPIDNGKYVDNSHMTEVVKKRHERTPKEERDGKPLDEQEPFNARKHRRDQKTLLDSISK